MEKKKSTSKERGISFDLLLAETQPDAQPHSPPQGRAHPEPRWSLGTKGTQAQPPAGEGKDPPRMERLLGPSSSPPSADHLALAAGGQCGRWLFHVPEMEAGVLMLRWAAPQFCAQLCRWHLNR